MKSAALLGGVGALGLTAAGCLAYGILIEQHDFRLREIRVPVLPQGHQPFTILHLSDFHLLPTHVKKIEWVRQLATLQPDFVINTGDNLSSADGLDALATMVEPFRGIPGVYVFGSNDIHAPRPINPLKYLFTSSRNPTLFKANPETKTHLPTRDIAEILDGVGWVFVEQVRHQVTLGDTAVEVRGCGDAHWNIDHYDRVMGPTDAELLIGVTHAPYSWVLNQMVDDGAGIMFTGHTHGGQVCLPGGRALTTNCDLPPGRAKGLSLHNHGDSSAWLHVSAGLGTSPKAPYRFFCRPEATLLTVSSATYDQTERPSHD
ncbi:MAG: metallophosphoesterase [Propionibacteriaceae bacterium]|nr:metallophosphoesterase [Propionibacteriaceae bacterium]